MSRARLGHDAHGAIMLLGVFMAVFLCAALYYVIGIGEAIVQRERMQDAADAAAFSAAVMHARGMNVLVLINQVMAALLAVLVALKLVETLTTIALVAIALVSFFAPGAATAIPPLSALRTEVRSAANAIKPSIDTALEALHAAAVGVREAVPAASVAEAIASDPAGDGTIHVIALPPSTSLPTIDGTFAELCERASEDVAQFTNFALDKFLPGVIAGTVSNAIEELTKAGSEWFCGASGAKPPQTTSRFRADYPQLPSRKACVEQDASQPDYDAARHEQACQQAELDAARSEPDDAGDCRGHCDVELFATRDTAARAACAPRSGHDALRGFDWQERHFTRTYVMHGGGWQRQSDAATEERTARYRRHKNQDVRPCGRSGAAIGPEWNLAPSSPDHGEALCAKEPLPEGPGHEQERVEVECVEVTHLFGCFEQVTRRDAVAAGKDERVAPSEGDSDQRVPQVLREGVELGGDEFQLRALAQGPLPNRSAEAVLRIATWKPQQAAADASTAVMTASRSLGRFALAQAEYFFDVADPDAQATQDMLWSMRWKARFRRVRMPQAAHHAGSDHALADACAAVAQPSEPAGDTACSLLDPEHADRFAH